MANSTSTPRSKQAGKRRVRVLYWDNRAGFGAVRITDDKGEHKDYNLDRISHPAGEAYLFEGPDAQRYTCVLARDGQTCECKGFQHRSCCRHVDCLVALKAANRI